MTAAWIGLGANLGDRAATLSRALEAMDRLTQTRVTTLSPTYETPPWGRTDQAEFLNAVARVETGLAAKEVLGGLLTIESALGRRREGERWGPREIDLDLLLYGDAVIREPDLTVPHPRLAERAFVLVPLHDLAPELMLPGLGRVDELLAALDDKERAGIEPGPALAFEPCTERTESTE